MAAPALRPLGTGEVLDVAFSLYRRHFAALATIAIISQAAGLVLTVYVEAAGGALENLLLWWISAVVSTVCAAIGMGASTKIVADSYLGKPATAGDALSWVLPHTGQIIVMTILGSLAVGLGLVLFLVPGMIIACGIAVSASALVVEGLGATDAMNRSWNLTKGHRWKVLGVVVVSVLTVYLVTIASAFIGGVLALVAGPSPVIGLLIVGVVTAALSVVTYPFIYCAVTVLYYDLRVRKEGFDLEVLESQLAPS